MGVVMQGRYVGNKKVELIHLPSGAKQLTSAPVDNNGDGSSFSPTDLTASSLGACMLTVIGIVAERRNCAMEGSWFEVEKVMSDNPRRIGSLPLSIHLPAALTAEEKELFERAALTCPVKASLHPEIKVELKFWYDVDVK